MDNTLIFSLFDETVLADTLSSQLTIEKGSAEIRYFPDGETYVRIDSDVQNKTILLIAPLDRPDQKIVPLFFLAETLKKSGAKKICLISPYLPYMRQDKQFKPGEAVTSVLFAKLLSSFIDVLITIDPHLHRINALSDIYSIPTITLHATQAIAEWIAKNISSPLIIGPDEESAQWVSDIAKKIDAPYAIIKKIRYGDRRVSISIPEINADDKTPVLIDDIVSTGTTMATVIQSLAAKQFQKPIAIVVHALFSRETEKNLLRAGAEKIISCNTISHFSNTIDISDLLLESLKNLLR